MPSDCNLRDGLTALLAQMDAQAEQLHAGWKRSKDQDVKVILAMKRGNTRFWADKVRTLLDTPELAHPNSHDERTPDAAP